MNSQNQNNPKGQSPEEIKKAQGQDNQSEELSEKDQKNVKGGSGLLSGGNDLTNVLGGSIGISNSSSGTDSNGHSYSSNDSHNVDLGLGNILDNTNY